MSRPRRSATVSTIRPAGGWSLGVTELWDTRELLWRFSVRNISIRYKQSLAGPGWAVFQPLIGMAIFTLFFGHVAKLSSGGAPYPIFYYAALTVWTYFSAGLGSGANSLVDNQAVLSKVYFPRVFLPLSYAVSGLMDLVIASALGVPLALAVGIVPGWQLVLLPIGASIAALACGGLSALLATLNAKYRDVRVVVPFLVQAGLFASPVVYPLSIVPSQYRVLYALNPMTSAIELFRYAFTGATSLTVLQGLVSAAAAGALFIAGFIYARRAEATLADVI